MTMTRNNSSAIRIPSRPGRVRWLAAYFAVVAIALVAAGPLAGLGTPAPAGAQDGETETAATPGFVFSPSALTTVEGFRSPYTVELKTKPTEQVVVSISSSSEDVTVEPDTLYFYAGNWDRGQRVLARAVEGSGGSTAVLSHTAVGGGYEIASGSVSVAVNTAPKFAVKGGVVRDQGTRYRFYSMPAQFYMIGEDFKLTLPRAISGDGELTYSFDQAGSGCNSMPALNSGGTNSNAPNAAVGSFIDLVPTYSYRDQVIDKSLPGSTDRGILIGMFYAPPGPNDSHGGIMYGRIPVAVRPSCYILRVQDADSIVSAEDVAFLSFGVSVVSPLDDEQLMLALPVQEGDEVLYTIRLAPGYGFLESGETVSVSIASDNSDVSVRMDAKTFSGNDQVYDQAQPIYVRVRAADDDDALPDTARLTHTVSRTGYDTQTRVAVITVADDDTPALAVSSAKLAVSEGSSGAYTVALETQPSGPVTVNIASSNADLTVKPATLTFTTDNWATAQTVEARAAADSDTADDTATLSHTASGGDYDSVTASVSVTVADTTVPDTNPGSRGGTPPSLAVSSAALSIAEGSSGAYTVALETQPSDSVTVNIASSNADVAVKPATLNFDAGNWDRLQSVRVAAAEGSAGSTAALSHTAVGGGYESASASVSVAVHKVPKFVAKGDVVRYRNDSQTYSMRTKFLMIREDFKLTLPGAIGGDGALTYSLSNTGLSCTRFNKGGTNSNAPNPAVSSLVSFYPARTYGNQVIDRSLPGSTQDDLLPVWMFYVPPGTDDSHGGIIYGRPPAAMAPTCFGLYVRDSDSIVSSDDTAALLFGISVVAPPDDAQLMLKLPLRENGYTTYRIRIPSGHRLDTGETVSVSIVSDNSDVSVGSKSITFNHDNQAQYISVDVRAADDDDALPDTARLTHTISRTGYDTQTRVAVITVADNDTPALAVSSAKLAVSEGSSSAYTVALKTQPSSSVTVNIASSNADVTVKPARLIFTADNWATAQTVEARAAVDSDTADDTATLKHTASGGDYDSVTASVSVAVTDTMVPDTNPGGGTNPGAGGGTSPGGGGGANPGSGGGTPPAQSAAPGIAVSSGTLRIAEGLSGAYTVDLETRPSGRVTVNIASSNADVTVKPATLTFTTHNWATAQSVEARAAADSDTADDTATLKHTASGGGYDNVTARVSVTVTEPEPAFGLVTSLTDLEVPEDGAASYTVRLESRPTGTVTVANAVTAAEGVAVGPVAIAVENAGGISVAPASLTFTADNWATPQTVTAQAAADDNGVNERATITHTASGGGYDNATARVSATAVEPPPPLGNISGLSATAGGAAGTIALTWTPGANATRHWIASVKDADRSTLAVWMAADNLDSHTVTGLDSGAAYILTVISGRDLAGSGESEWSAWAPWVVVMPD